ncbi:MAG: hypothetical protein C4551_05755 [Bacillota bacterium]|nr:MAG: hypothetical protein C4551_05755 [Bacillota bacterium]
MGEPTAFGFKRLAAWLEELGSRETHHPVHYDLEVDLRPASGRVGVRGTVDVLSSDRRDTASVTRAVSATGPAEAPAPPSGAPGSTTAAFLLNPDLTLLEAGDPRDPAPDADVDIPAPDSRAAALRAAPLDSPVSSTAGTATLSFAYRGTLPSSWVSSRTVELALYNLWYPLFSSRLGPFTFRMLLRVPPEMVPAVNGRLVPLPPDLLPDEHDDDAPRGYLWESTGPATDIAVCAGPYMVHQETRDGVSVEIHVLFDDYDLGDMYIDWAGRILRTLTRWFGPLPGAGPQALTPPPPETAVSLLTRQAPIQPPVEPPVGPPAGPPVRLGIVIPPHSNWGGYTRASHIVLPRPMAVGLRDAGDTQRTALWLAHEMGHLWHGSGVLSDSVNEPWMSEGFAEFARLVFTEAEWGEAAYRQGLDEHRDSVRAARAALPMAAVRWDHPEAHALARLRGGLMLAELRDLLGDDTLSSVLRGFTGRFTGRVARGGDFVRWASRAAGTDLTGFFARYLEAAPGE